MDRRRAETEFKAIAESPIPGDYLGHIVLRHVQLHPSDPDLPEALYRVVRAAHFACSAKPKTAAARRAFQTLHRQFPDTVWAKKTPVWF